MGMDQERLLTYHRFTREHGVNRPLYFLARLILVPLLLVYFRLSRIGREHGRVSGPLIVAANHRSFLDPFVIGASLPWRRPLHYVAKVELFKKRWHGWILNRLGAYPVWRGQSDEQTLVTSREVLERGGAVCIFPEGTRHRTGSLGRPKRGFGRLALETGAAVLPVACTGPSRCAGAGGSVPRRSRCGWAARSPFLAPRIPRRPSPTQSARGSGR